jgi:hypothetical protein
MELPDQYSDTDSYLERIRRRRAEEKLPRNARDEMLELFVDRINAGNIADGFPEASFGRVAKMLEGIPTGDLYALFQKCQTYRKFGAGLRHELKPKA